MKRYVLGFAFNQDKDMVLLIIKKRPEWQANHANGIGGKIEPGEKPIDAMLREFKEETGYQSLPTDWSTFGMMQGPEWLAHLFVSFTIDTDMCGTTTDEQVWLCTVNDLHKCKTVSNIPWLVHMALDQCGVSSDTRFYSTIQYF